MPEFGAGQSKDYARCTSEADADSCVKAGLKEAATDGCVAAAAAYTGGAAAPLCGPIAGVLVDMAYPVVKALVVDSFAGFGQLLAGIHPAIGVFSPVGKAWDWYTTSAISSTWNSSVDAVLQAWHAGRAAAGLLDAPMPPPISGVPAWRSWRAAHGDKGMWPSEPISERRNAEDLLYQILYSMPDGWGTPALWSRDTSEWGNNPLEGSAGVSYEARLGLVQDAWNQWAEPEQTEHTGIGPFAIFCWGWPERCSESNDCMGLFAAGVHSVWATQLERLRRALPLAIHGVAYRLTSDSYDLTGKAEPTPATPAKHTAARVLVGTVVVAGAGAATWPLWGSHALRWATKLWRALQGRHHG